MAGADQLSRLLDRIEGLDPIPASDARDLLAAWNAALEHPEAARAELERALTRTAHPAFLESLDVAGRERWVDLVLGTIRALGHDLHALLASRAQEQPDHPLFEELDAVGGQVWTYRAVWRRVRQIAAVLWECAGGARPRVALWTQNCVEGACADLACLTHDALVTPLSVHLAPDEVEWVLRRLQVNIAIADTEERVRRLLQLRDSHFPELVVLALTPGRSVDEGEARLLAELAAGSTSQKVEAILAARPRLDLDAPLTVMFTSGSTGRPKGLVFSGHHLIAKRYCRAAALPAVGRDERLLCYLPLFHTFGRYLEMLGTIFWRGTYVFAGNPSLETLLAGIEKVRPTGLISIPLRWQQLRDEVLRRSDAGGDEAEVFATSTGGRLRWGLSAAGYLDPRVFRFFHRHGVQLGSGFGMTEATGGITMSPPGDYLDDTVGVPLPGIDIRLDESGEMLISGAYVAHYLREDGEGLELEPGEELEGRTWLRTGDVFRRLERGHLQIVDRVKDIYKNSRGQTVAPRRVEDQFQQVPGIRRVFLVGDHRPWNALLIVPDLDDPVLRDAPDEHSRHEYLGHVVAAANRYLAPYERVVNYTLLERDFTEQRGELTPKGSYRRKAIEESFGDVIERMYRHPYLSLRVGDLEVRLPHWLVRDMGALEDDLVASEASLVDRRRGVELRVSPDGATGRVAVGDLAYEIKGNSLDLGRLTRQPDLWLGNPQLTRFCPCKDGWDVSFGEFGEQVWLRRGIPPGAQCGSFVADSQLDPLLEEADRLVQLVLHAESTDALAALSELTELLGRCDEQLDHTVRRRLTALAEHPDENLRCEAYRVLLLDELSPRYNEAFGPFVDSGLSFLNHASIRSIASMRFGSRRIEALRQRLAHYRAERRWPSSAVARRQFLDVLRLLVDFAREQPDHYHPVRCELASWALLDQDPELAHRASELLDHLVAEHEDALERAVRERPPLRREQVVFDDDVSEDARLHQWELLTKTAFLDQSIQLAFNEPDFDPATIPDGGLWISAASSNAAGGYYRWSIRAGEGRLYQLFVVVRRDLSVSHVLETNYWMLAIGGHPFGERVLPRFGCARPSLGAMSLAYVDDLSVDERIRRTVGALRSGGERQTSLDWRDLYVRGIGAVIRTWNNSTRRLAPRVLRTDNVVVPEIDIREGARVLSLARWGEYRRPSDLLVPVWRGFYARVLAQTPECAEWIDPAWLVDALIEVLGKEEGAAFVAEAIEDSTLPSDLRTLLQEAQTNAVFDHHVPQSARNARLRFERWVAINPAATLEAQADQVDSLLSLYRLARYGEVVRSYLYRHTVFAHAPAQAREIFDRLLDVLMRDPTTSATRRVELSELQAVLDEPLRAALARMVFPHARRLEEVDVLTFGEPGHQHVTVRTHIEDRLGIRYDVREPMGADEVGQVYRIFYREQFARAASESDRFLVVLDADQRVVAGLIYRDERRELVHLEGCAVTSSLWGRGIATALLEDFGARSEGRGVRVVRTNFVMRAFLERRGYRVDRRWGGLVRFLGSEADAATPQDADPR